MRAWRIAMAAVVAAIPAIAAAGGSSPALSLTAADTFVTTAGVRGVEVRGSFNFEDVVQGVFPAGLVVVQGTRFVRYDQAGGVVEGEAAFLADGLDAAEVPGLLGLGAPSASPAAVTQLRPDRIAVVLPATFSPGAAVVVLYGVHEGEGFASNGLGVTLP